MATISRLPASGCRYFLNGRCLYEEELNPGYNLDFRCVLLRRWERAFDDFLGRAEAFGLAQASAADAWARRFERLLGEDADCPDYRREAGRDLPDCVHCRGDICVKALPECPGHCLRFQPAQRRGRGAES
jgi:hypothetical protein